MIQNLMLLHEKEYRAEKCGWRQRAERIKFCFPFLANIGRARYLSHYLAHARVYGG